MTTFEMLYILIGFTLLPIALVLEKLFPMDEEDF